MSVPRTPQNDVSAAYTPEENDVSATYIPAQTELGVMYDPEQSDFSVAYMFTPVQTEMTAIFATKQSYDSVMYAQEQSDFIFAYSTEQSSVSITCVSEQSGVSIMHASGRSLGGTHSTASSDIESLTIMSTALQASFLVWPMFEGPWTKVTEEILHTQNIAETTGVSTQREVDSRDFYSTPTSSPLSQADRTTQWSAGIRTQTRLTAARKTFQHACHVLRVLLNGPETEIVRAARG